MEYPKDYVNQILQGDSLTVLKTLPSESVNCVVTSPPYWSLRDYQVEGQLGLEKTFEEYITKLCDIFDEVKRVLRKDGTCWVNLGDTYSAKPTGSLGGIFADRPSKIACMEQRKYSKDNNFDVTEQIPSKSLCLIPQRFAIEMVNRGWILRNTIIWHKPNCMPSSANDRFTVDFEYLFFFVKSKKYWFEQQFETMLSNDYDLNRMKNGRKEYKGKWSGNENAENFGSPRARTQRKTWDSKRIQSAFVAGGTNGRNKRCVWIISTKPFPEAHFATFPEALIETPIQAGCPRYVCKKCGKGREKILEKVKMPIWNKTGKIVEAQGVSGCNAGFEGGIVLDPFMGAGTTAVVAKKQGKKYIGIELKQEYIDMANKRIRKIPESLF